MTFIFRNKTIFWDISKWNRGQTKWDGGQTKWDGGQTNSHLSLLLTSLFLFTTINSPPQQV